MTLQGNSEMMQEFIDNKGEKPAKPKAARTQMQRKKRIAPVSEDRERDLKRWALIRQSMIEAQVKTNGWTSCMECGLQNPQRLDLDHIIPSGKGGVWFPSNAQLLCRGPGTSDCHGRKHGQPEFSSQQEDDQ